MKVLSIAAYLLLLIACYGWGLAVFGRTDSREKVGVAFLSMLGLSVLVFAGGVLNAIHLAYPSMLWLLLLAGAAMAGIRIMTISRAGMSYSLPAPNSLPQLLPALILSVAVIFYATILLPSPLFNYADDLHTYVLRPIRMLQTGTLGGNPYDLLGMDSWGGQAFLQGFVLLAFPAQYLVGLDAVFGFAMTGLLLSAFARRYSLHWSVTCFAMLALLAINPQTVNISVIYLGSALMLGMAYACMLLLEHLDDPVRYRRYAILLGLVVATLINFKITLVSFALSFLAIYIAGLLWFWHDRRKVLGAAGITALGTIAAALPWLILHAPHYLAAIQAGPEAGWLDNGLAPSGRLLALLANVELIYGGSVRAYAVAALSLVAVSCYAAFRTFSSGGDIRQRGYALVVFSASTAGFISYLFNGFVFPPALAIRNSCPVLIATFPFALMAVTRIVRDGSTTVSAPAWPVLIRGLSLSVSALVALLFWNNFTTRIERAVTQHHVFAFQIENGYGKFIRYAFSPEAKQAILDIQTRMPPGEKILAWFSMPFLLDFGRNEIYAAMDPGLINPWLQMPVTGNPDDVVRYLKSQGVRYVMWQYNGPGMIGPSQYQFWIANLPGADRAVGRMGLYLTRVFNTMLANGKYVFRSNSIVLFDLQQF